jgi:hypothetical protein
LKVNGHLPSIYLAAGVTLKLTVIKPAPGGGISAALVLNVNNPAPGVGLVSPAIVPAGSTALTLMVTGTNFTPNSAVLVNGSARQTAYVTSEPLRP